LTPKSYFFDEYFFPDVFQFAGLSHSSAMSPASAVVVVNVPPAAEDVVGLRLGNAGLLPGRPVV
jgi:hypothetical protein